MIKRTKSRVKKMAIIIIIVIVLVFAIAQTAMIIDTQRFMRYAHGVFDGSINQDNRTERTGELWIYMGYANNIPNNAEYSYSLHRFLTWHNFQQGFIYVTYNQRYHDKDTGKYVWGIGEQRIWYIEKVDGEWQLVGMNPIRA